MFKLFNTNWKNIQHTTINNVKKLSSYNIILKYKGLMLSSSSQDQKSEIISTRNDKLLSRGDFKSLFINEKRNVRHI